MTTPTKEQRPMATNEEVARVRGIHRVLDLWASACFPQKEVYLDGNTKHVYTAAEVRAWPATKAKLEKLLTQEPEAWLVMSVGHGIGSLWSGDNETTRREKESIARGLCMYREQLSDPASPTEDAGGKGVMGMDPAYDAPQSFKEKCAAFNAAQQAKAAPQVVDPYTHHRVNIDAELTMVAMSNRPGNEAARLRNIAALKAELSDSTANRRARLEAKFGPRPCDEWPKGDWRNEP